FAHLDQVDQAVDLLGQATAAAGPGADPEPDFGTDPVAMVVSAISVAAPPTETPRVAIERAVEIGGSPLGGLTGAILGARMGIRVWPWTFPNDTWFVAVGQRLIAGTAELADLPV